MGQLPPIKAPAAISDAIKFPWLTVTENSWKYDELVEGGVADEFPTSMERAGLDHPMVLPTSIPPIVAAKVA
jgi:hypothetical protein